jgi:diguanylate cyclase
MATENTDFKELHWLIGMLQTIDVGMVVLDRDFKIQVWNAFMENHSGRSPDETSNRVIFELFSELDEAWFRQKSESVFQLKSSAFITWEVRPYLFKFKNYRPITGTAEFMYQNVTISPLVSIDGSINHVCVTVYDVTDFASNKQALEETNQVLKVLSRTDRLTSLNNRGYWEECLEHEFNQLQRYAKRSTLIIFDIDHFKKVNDTNGHQAGDEVIRIVSDQLASSLRKTDIPGRYGGEEFAIIMPETIEKHAFIYCERLRKEIESTVVIYDEIEIKFTISFGICESSDHHCDYQNWLERADQALYQAKENGRNQSRIFDLSSLDI